MRVNSIKSGAIWSMIGQIINVVFGFIIIILTTRFLGPENYGLLQTMLTLIILAVMIADLGISSSVARYIAENQNNNNLKLKYIFNGLLLKLLSTFLIIIFLLKIFPFFEELLNVSIDSYTLLLITITLLRSFREFLLKVLQGLRRLDLSTKFNLMYNIGNLMLVSLFLFLGLGIRAILISEIIVTFVFLITFLYLNTRLQIIVFNKLEKNITKKLLIYSIPMFFISMSFYLYMKADTLMIQYFMDNSAVGFYSLATIIIGQVHMPMVAIGHSTGPALVSLDKEEKTNQLLKVIQTTLLLTLPICVGLFLTSREFITVFFGMEYLPTVIILQFMTVFLFFYCINSVLSPVLDYLGYAKVRAIMVGISASLNIALNILFIPEFGVLGAVYSTLITYTIYSLTIIITVFRKVIGEVKLYIETAKLFMKILFASLCMGVIVTLTKVDLPNEIYSLIISIGIGIVAYVALIFLLKVINKNEVKILLKK